MGTPPAAALNCGELGRSGAVIAPGGGPCLRIGGSAQDALGAGDAGTATDTVSRSIKSVWSNASSVSSSVKSSTKASSVSSIITSVIAPSAQGGQEYARANYAAPRRKRSNRPLFPGGVCRPSPLRLSGQLPAAAKTLGRARRAGFGPLPIESLVGELVGELFRNGFAGLFDHWFGHLALPQGWTGTGPPRVWTSHASPFNCER